MTQPIIISCRTVEDFGKCGQVVPADWTRMACANCKAELAMSPEGNRRRIAAGTAAVVMCNLCATVAAALAGGAAGIEMTAAIREQIASKPELAARLKLFEDLARGR